MYISRESNLSTERRLKNEKGVANGRARGGGGRGGRWGVGGHNVDNAYNYGGHKVYKYGGHPAPSGRALHNLINAVKMLKSKPMRF